MTVGELIEALKQFPTERRVYYLMMSPDLDTDGYKDSYSFIEHVEVDKTIRISPFNSNRVASDEGEDTVVIW